MGRDLARICISASAAGLVTWWYTAIGIDCWSPLWTPFIVVCSMAIGYCLIPPEEIEYDDDSNDETADADQVTGTSRRSRSGPQRLHGIRHSEAWHRRANQVSARLRSTGRDSRRNDNTVNTAQGVIGHAGTADQELEGVSRAPQTRSEQEEGGSHRKRQEEVWQKGTSPLVRLSWLASRGRGRRTGGDR